jgi:hypothetical protein
MTVVDFAQNGPPEGEKGHAGTDTLWRGDLLFAAYDSWSGTLSREPTAADLASMLDRDGKAEAIANVLTLPLRWADVQIVPQEGDTGEAELVSRALLTPPHEGGMSTPLDHVIAQMATAVWQRRAFFEKVFRIEDGTVTYKKLALRPAESCQIKRGKRTGDFEGFRQSVPWDHPHADADGYVQIEAEKALVYVHDQARAPLTGRSAMQTAYRCFEARQKLRFLWFVFLERFATPWATTSEATNDPKAAGDLARKAAGLRGGGVLGLSEGQSLELLEPTADGGAFIKAMDWLGSEMSGSVLAGFTDLASSAAAGRGSLALSRDASDFFLRSCEARSSEMGAVLTIYAASDLVRWNRGPGGKTPTVKFGKLSDEHKAEALDLFKALSTQPVPDERIPAEFFDVVLEAVAATLGPKAADIVHRAIEARNGQSDVERVNGVASTAAALVTEAGLAPDTASV